MRFPIMKAFGATIAYLAQHAVDLVKALWLPVLLLMAAMATIMPDYLDSAAALLALGANPDPNAMVSAAAPLIRAGAILMLASAVFYPMMIVAALRHVVRGDRQKMPFYLGFGGDELRTLGAYVLLFVMLFLAYLVFVLALFVIGGVFALISPAAAGIGAMIAAIAGLVGFCWFVARLSVMFPAALATKTLGIAQSWRATKGNSARLIVYWILVAAPLIALSVAFFVLFMGDAFPIYAELFEAGADPEAQNAANRKLLELQRAYYDIKSAKFWPYAVGTFLYTIAIMAIVNVAAGIAWRCLTDRPAPISDDVGMRMAA